MNIPNENLYNSNLWINIKDIANDRSDIRSPDWSQFVKNNIDVIQNESNAESGDNYSGLMCRICNTLSFGAVRTICYHISL